MPKFTGKAKTIQQQVQTHPQATTNYEGGLAFEMEPFTKLYTMSCTALLEDKFYVDADTHRNQLLETIQAVGEMNPRFLLQLGSYLRQEMYLRSMPVMLFVEATQFLKGQAGARRLIRHYAPQIIARADEPREALAYYISRFGEIGERGPQQSGFKLLKIGLDAAIRQFDAYQLAKYWGKGKDVTMRDVLRLVRPKPSNEEQDKLWGLTVKGELPTPDTWEVYLSTKGASKETWESILPKMGIMARIRNLRNFLEQGVSTDMLQKHVIEPLHNQETIAKSKQLPFRWYAAYRALNPTVDPQRDSVYGRSMYSRQDRAPKDSIYVHPMYSTVLEALETAVKLSIVNVPHLGGMTFITADNSGSMDSSISQKSTIRCWEISNLLAAMSRQICDSSLVSVFGTYHKVVPVQDGANIFDTMFRMRKTDVEHSTDAWKAIAYLIEQNLGVDRILLFSDMQCYQSRSADYGWLTDKSLTEEWEKYKRMCSHKPYLYSIDLNGYGASQFPEDKQVATLAGWSDKIFQFIVAFEEDKVQAVQRIMER